MSSITKYESLKSDGTSIDRFKYVLSLSDKTEIEKHLKESSIHSSDDLQTLILLSISTKNQTNLLEIFKTDLFPTKARTYAGKFWIKLQKDEKQIQNFLVETINNKNVPRYIKYQILNDLRQIIGLKKSCSFFYDLARRLTETNNHREYNIDAHLLPFCKKEQIFDLLSRWSIKRFEQIDSSSPFYSKLINYQPIILIHLIKEDLKHIKSDYQKFSEYFTTNEKLFESIAQKEAKELICLTIDYLNQLEKHQRFLPNLIKEKQKYFFKKAPDQMIELITIAARNQPGSIKYRLPWGNQGSELGAFSFPRSFSCENYLRLFFILYEKSNWSSNNTIRLLQYILQNQSSDKSLSSIKKQRKWFFDIVVNQRIGKELFLKKLLKEGNETTLQLLNNYSELTTPLSVHLLSKFERNGIVKAPQRLSLIRYQTMTKQIFDQFLSLFKQIGSDLNQRQKTYPLFFECALSTDEQYVQQVIRWIEKRFLNEQLIVIETFLCNFPTYNQQFHLEILPNCLESIESIIDIAINHFEQSTTTLQYIINYGIFLLKSSEQYSNKQQKDKIIGFATKIIKRCYSKNDSVSFPISSISSSYLLTRNIIVDILVSDVFPKLVSKQMIDQLNNLLSSCQTKFWRLPEIDSFLNTFFRKSLPSSTKLQSSFRIDQHSELISLYLKNKSTRFERVNQLINQIDKLFFIDKYVQQIVLRSQQHCQLIDQLIEDEKCVTLDKLSNEQSQFAPTLTSETKNLTLPGLYIDVLSNCSQLLTGKEQEHITNIILNDYLQDPDVSNLNKLKSLRILRRLTQRYNQIVQWIDQKEDSSLVVKNPNEGSSGRKRGAGVQPLDDIIICLPATFDLTQQDLVKHLQLLKRKLNAKNAKFISDAMLNISRKISDQIFLENYFDFVRNEQFSKLGITANKEILRLLVEYISNTSLVEMIIKPLWDSHPHQDVRACIILTLLHFIRKSNSNDDQTIIWTILEEAADDEYLPVVKSLFAAQRGQSRWPLTQLKNSSDPIFERFVNQIQFKVLDHQKSLEAREYAWSNIDYEYSNTKKLIEKAQQLCIQFDKDGNTLWKNAFQKLISLYKLNQISSIDIIIDLIKKMMSCREEIDSKENGLDNLHDLPVYRRIQCLLTNINNQINQFDNQKKISFHYLILTFLQFDKTLAPQVGALLIKISQNKEDLQNVLKTLEDNLPQNYFQRILTRLSTILTRSDSCPFIQQLNLDEKLQLALWFIKEKNRPLFVFNLLKDFVFNQPAVDQELCRDLLRQFRLNEDLDLRQQAMKYTVPWNEDGTIGSNDDDRMSVSSESAF